MHHGWGVRVAAQLGKYSRVCVCVWEGHGEDGGRGKGEEVLYVICPYRHCAFYSMQLGRYIELSVCMCVSVDFCLSVCITVRVYM